MCMSCLSTAELTLMQGTAVAAFVKGGVVRAHDLLIGRPAWERQLEAHEANADFLRTMGLDPDTVLGPPPATGAAATRLWQRVPAHPGPAFAPAGG